MVGLPPRRGCLQDEGPGPAWPLLHEDGPGAPLSSLKEIGTLISPVNYDSPAPGRAGLPSLSPERLVNTLTLFPGLGVGRPQGQKIGSLSDSGHGAPGSPTRQPGGQRRGDKGTARNCLGTTQKSRVRTGSTWGWQSQYEGVGASGTSL